MKCDKCEQEATVHEVSIKGGKRQEKHLCEKCARDQGVGPVQSHAPVEKLVQGYIAAQSKPEAQGPQTTVICPGCGLAFAQFRSTGVLGCPKCYAAFEGQLSPLLARAHEGGTHHVGKSPESSDAARASLPATESPRVSEEGERVARRLGVLRRSLEEAVRGEQYEKAAALRDEIQRLQGPAVPGSSRLGDIEGRQGGPEADASEPRT